LLAISKCAETYKPVISDGSTKELLMKIILVVTNTESINLTINPTIVFATKQDINNLTTIVNNEISDLHFQTASGTGTVITLTINQTLVNGLSITFVASANNSGNATTINGKPVYKPNTTTVPNLIAGKAYTVWYNSTGNCFFIKASAEGDVIASQVLAGKKFSNDNDTGLTGIMPNNGALNYSLPINGTYNISSGYTTGGSITQSIPVKTAQTYNPSTSTQTISLGQYLSGNQVIAPVTGNANVNDVVAGKTFSSANGINLVGQATLQSLGGRQYDSNSFTASNYPTNYTLPFTPTIVLLHWINNGSWWVWNSIYNVGFASANGRQGTEAEITISGNVITIQPVASGNYTYYAWS
jgi:phage-related tail fiber protein